MPEAIQSKIISNMLNTVQTNDMNYTFGSIDAKRDKYNSLHDKGISLE